MRGKSTGDRRPGAFPSAERDAAAAKPQAATPQTEAPSYRLAYTDVDFLLRDELRPVRFQLELLKPELVLQDNDIESTIVVFGSARIPEPDAARRQHESCLAALERSPEDPDLSRQAALAERRYEVLRTAVEDILHQPSRGELFPALFPIIGAANGAGAYGSYLSGGGSTVAAFVSPQVAEAVASAMLRMAQQHGLEATTRVVALRAAGTEVVES